MVSTGTLSQANEQHRLPVVIVGAGVAGLRAGNLLKQSGAVVSILEGRNRIGGRTHTVPIMQQEQQEANPQTAWVDVGAAWIDGCPMNSVYKLAVKEYNLPCTKMPYVNVWRLKIYHPERNAFLSWWESLWMFFRIKQLLDRFEGEAYVEGECKDFPNMKERLDALLPPKPSSSSSTTTRDAIRSGFQAVQENLNAAPLDLIHAYSDAPNLFETETYDQGDEHMLNGGYKKLVDQLAEPLVDDIWLNQMVTCIETITQDNQNSGSPSVGNSTPYVRVTTSDGTSYSASHVLVTVPLGVLKAESIEFVPPLPSEKKDAIARMGFGQHEKLVMTFSTPFWRQHPNTTQNILALVSSSQGSTARFPFLFDVTATAGCPALSLNMVTPVAQEFLACPQVVITEATQFLRQMFRDKYQEPLDIATSQWQPDPCSRGSYPFIGTETRPGDMHRLAEPFGLIHFAGDAMGRHLGYVEGALKSGEHEAKQILALLKS